MNMQAMLLTRICDLSRDKNPLTAAEVMAPALRDDEILIRISACGVCHTELDEIEGRMPPPCLPVILGHQAAGRVDTIGKNVSQWKAGDRAGVAWIFSSCGLCEYCRAGSENLCGQFRATGRDANGGYAQYMSVPAAFAYPLPDSLTDAQAAPLLCAGAIGYRSLNLTGLRDGQNLGLTGFGASAHLVLMEKEIKSVANVSRLDVREFLRIAGHIPLRPEIQEYPLEEANRAILEIKEKKIRGAKVLRIG